MVNTRSVAELATIDNQYNPAPAAIPIAAFIQIVAAVVNPVTWL
jgi:hypothetical protein